MLSGNSLFCFVKNDDCQYSHDAEPTRKMELCKFYLMDCCAKKDKCLYLHSDFPCKFYHTGLKCFQKDDCKFAHGKPLTSDFKNILLKVFFYYSILQLLKLNVGVYGCFE